MSALKSLTLTALPKAEQSPVQLRRSRLIERLEDQKSLLKDPAHVRVVQRWKKQDGERVLTERKLWSKCWRAARGEFRGKSRMGSKDGRLA